MSILIKNMEMPENCTKCRFNIDGWCYVCLPGSMEEHKRVTTNYCPLRPVPAQHGRLIDADKLKAIFLPIKINGKSTSITVSCVRQVIDDAETVIPAEVKVK